jgi:predicted component of type VI protein secretion system
VSKARAAGEGQAPPGGGAAAEAKAFEAAVEREAKRFDLRPLLDLLREKGYRDILFQGATAGKTSPSIVESVHFERRPRRLVRITLNLGLLSDGTLLPSYFFRVADASREPDRFYEFLGFFEHRLVDEFVNALYPEAGGRALRDWGDARRSLFKMHGAGSPATLQWLAQLYFPELRARVGRWPFLRPSTAHALRTGASPLDGSGVLGHSYESHAEGLSLDLIAEEETDARGRGWAGVVAARLRDKLFPLLAPFRLPLTVRLHVLFHASWARVEAPDDPKGYLGYDRLRELGDEASGHTVVLYRGVVGEDGDLLFGGEREGAG